MNNQEFFDASVRHLRQQGERAINYAKQCVYEMDVGGGRTLMCAVGGVMTPELRQLCRMEGVNGNGARMLRSCLPAADKFFGDVNTELMEHMQIVHDNEPVECWETRFAGVARKYGLVYTESEVAA